MNEFDVLAFDMTDVLYRVRSRACRPAPPDARLFSISRTIARSSRAQSSAQIIVTVGNRPPAVSAPTFRRY